MRWKKSSMFLAMAVFLSGCATLVEGQREHMLETIRVAAATDPAELFDRAEAGDAEAQHAYAVVLQYGLRGVPVDLAGADAWRSRATAQRGTLPITQYTPAFNGQPSRVNLIYVPRYDMSLYEIQVVSACAAALHARTPTPACGDAEHASELAVVWAAASH